LREFRLYILTFKSFLFHSNKKKSTFRSNLTENAFSENCFFYVIYFSLILQPGDLIRWKQVAARFSELITEAAAQLRRDEQHGIYTETINSTSYTDVRNIYWKSN